MDDMSELLSGILNSPEGMENLKKAASALLKGSSENEQKNQPSYGGGSDPAVQSLLRSLTGEPGQKLQVFSYRVSLWCKCIPLPFPGIQPPWEDSLCLVFSNA